MCADRRLRHSRRSSCAQAGPHFSANKSGRLEDRQLLFALLARLEIRSREPGAHAGAGSARLVDAAFLEYCSGALALAILPGKGIAVSRHRGRAHALCISVFHEVPIIRPLAPCGAGIVPARRPEVAASTPTRPPEPSSRASLASSPSSSATVVVSFYWPHAWFSP